MPNKDSKYYSSFVEMVDYSCKAAHLLKDIVTNFEPDGLSYRMVEMHEIEHTGDVTRHVMIKKLSKEHRTPIEREDIMNMAEAIDQVTDSIEDVLIRLYMFNIQEIREDAKQMTAVIVKCCEALKSALTELPNFKKSKDLPEKIIFINQLEEEADKIYAEAVRKVYIEPIDPILVHAWYETFQFLEDCCDACEDVANIIESVIWK